MKQVLKLLMAILVLAGCNSSNQNGTAKDGADSIYFGGDIITMEGDSANYVEAVVVKGGKVYIEKTKHPGSQSC